MHNPDHDNPDFNLMQIKSRSYADSPSNSSTWSLHIVIDQEIILGRSRNLKSVRFFRQSSFSF